MYENVERKVTTLQPLPFQVDGPAQPATKMRGNQQQSQDIDDEHRHPFEGDGQFHDREGDGRKCHHSDIGEQEGQEVTGQGGLQRPGGESACNLEIRPKGANNVKGHHDPEQVNEATQFRAGGRHDLRVQSRGRGLERMLA